MAFPKTALVLGSGLGRFAEKLTGARTMSYADIPGFSRSTVAGHSGTLLVGGSAICRSPLCRDASMAMKDTRRKR